MQMKLSFARSRLSERLSDLQSQTSKHSDGQQQYNQHQQHHDDGLTESFHDKIPAAIRFRCLAAEEPTIVERGHQHGKVYTKFVQPEKLKHVTVANMFQATSHLQKNRLSFAFALWTPFEQCVVGDSGSRTWTTIQNPDTCFWTVYEYETSLLRFANFCRKQLLIQPALAVGTNPLLNSNHDANPDQQPTLSATSPKNEPDVHAIFEMLVSQHDWLSHSASVALCLQSDDLRNHFQFQRITHFRRYGQQKKFEFLTEWMAPTSVTTTFVASPGGLMLRRVWLKYTDLACHQGANTAIKHRWSDKLNDNDLKYSFWEQDPFWCDTDDDVTKEIATFQPTTVVASRRSLEHKRGTSLLRQNAKSRFKPTRAREYNNNENEDFDDDIDLLGDEDMSAIQHDEKMHHAPEASNTFFTHVFSQLSRFQTVRVASNTDFRYSSVDPTSIYVVVVFPES